MAGRFSVQTRRSEVTIKLKPGRRSAAKLLSKDEARAVRGPALAWMLALAGCADEGGTHCGHTTSQALRSIIQHATALNFLWRYQTYFAASAITMATTMTNAAICTQKLLAKPLCRFITGSPPSITGVVMTLCA
jgi:hypothetical protein